MENTITKERDGFTDAGHHQIVDEGPCPVSPRALQAFAAALPTYQAEASMPMPPKIPTPRVCRPVSGRGSHLLQDVAHQNIP